MAVWEINNVYYLIMIDTYNLIVRTKKIHVHHRAPLLVGLLM